MFALKMSLLKYVRALSCLCNIEKSSIFKLLSKRNHCTIIKNWMQIQFMINGSLWYCGYEMLESAKIKKYFHFRSRLHLIMPDIHISKILQLICWQNNEVWWKVKGNFQAHTEMLAYDTSNVLFVTEVINWWSVLCPDCLEDY